MNSQSIMVIDPALEIPEIESYNGIAVRSPVNTSYHLPAIHSSKTMENQIENACGVILMGSAASVHDSLDWINDTRAIIQKAVDKKIPILGICFGHQFLAHFFGGTVDYLWDTVKRRGVRKVQILKNNLLNNDQEGDLIYSHQEGVTSCPPDFDVSARSSMVEIEAIVHKSLPIWGFQPHIEASKTFTTRIGINGDDFKKAKPFSVLLLEAFLKKIKI